MWRAAIVSVAILFPMTGRPLLWSAEMRAGEDRALPVRFEFASPKDLDFWTLHNLESPTIRDGCLSGATVGTRTSLESGRLSIDADACKGLEMLVRSDKSGLGYIHWQVEGRDKMISSDGFVHRIVGGNRFHIATIDFTSPKTKGWKGTVTKIRLDVINRPYANIQIRYIRFVPRLKHLPNADFVACDEKGALVGWMPLVEKGDAATEVHSDRKTGQRRLKITLNGPDARACFQVRVHGALPGTRYRATGLFRASRSARPLLCARFLDINGKEIRRSVSKGHMPTERDQWQAGELPFSIPPDAADTFLCFGAEGGDGTALWKDMDLQEQTGAPPQMRDERVQIAKPFRLPSSLVPGKLPRCKIIVEGGAPKLQINGEIVPPYFFNPCIKNTYGPGSDLSLIKAFGDRGIHLYAIYVAYYAGPRKDYMGAWAPDWWLGPGKYDFRALDAQIRQILATDPQAYILLKVGVNAPDWWLKAHPEELTEHVDGTKDFQSFASRKWLRDMGEALRELVRHVRSSACSSRIIGYFPGAGISFEWQYWGAHPGMWGNAHRLADYSLPMKRFFRSWLESKYDSDVGKLRAAWHDGHVTFESAEIPDKVIRGATELFIFRDPEVAQHVMDFLRCLADATAEAVIHFCRICKEETDGHALTGVYYGYILELFNHAIQHSGHLGFAKTLESPYVDFFSAPSSYGPVRFPRAPAAFMYPVDSIALHGKLVINEEDQRTHVIDKAGMAFAGISDMKDNVHTMRRNVMLDITKNVGLWWAEMLPGWFNDTTTLDAMAQLKGIYDANYPLKKRRNEVAVLVDDRSPLYLVQDPTALLKHLVNDQRMALGLMGAPYDTYLLRDLRREDFPDYRLYVFLNAFALDAEDRAAIDRKLKRDNKTLLWIFAPGLFNGQSYSAENMKAATGIDIKFAFEAHPPAVVITDDSHPVTRGLRGRIIGEAGKLGPTFYARDPGALVLGKMKYVRERGLVVKEFDGWRSIYVASPGLPASLLRNIARYAGVHVYCESDDAIYADGNILAVHSRTEGEKHISLPEKRDVYDVFRQEYTARDVRSFRLQIRAGVTEAFRLEAPRR